MLQSTPSAQRSRNFWRTAVTLCTFLTGTPLAGAEAAPKEISVLSSGDCFRYPSYDEWIEFLRSSERPGASAASPVADPARSFPRAAYENFQATIECTFFRYLVDGAEVNGFTARPRERGSEKIPALIYNRGGNGPAGQVTFTRLLTEIFPLAAKGYFLIGSQYRVLDEFGGKDVDDVLALVTLIDQQPQVDGERIGMLGWSRGGLMTISATSRTDRVRAIAIVGTPADLHDDLRLRPDMEAVYVRLIPGYLKNKEAALRARSPLSLVASLPAGMPVLILQGGADQRTRPVNALRLAMKLAELDRTYKLVVYPRDDHGLRAHQAEARQEILDWFGAELH
jgi:dipeptidyl aminopeptidase/acylaminoacyl peptidase